MATLLLCSLTKLLQAVQQPVDPPVRKRKNFLTSAASNFVPFHPHTTTTKPPTCHKTQKLPAVSCVQLRQHLQEALDHRAAACVPVVKLDAVREALDGPRLAAAAQQGLQLVLVEAVKR